MHMLIKILIFSIIHVFFTQGLFNDLWANTDQFPFHVSIRAVSANGVAPQVCSGAFITSHFVITSARCIARHQDVQLRLNSITHYTGGDVLTSREVFIHPDYNQQNSTFDVALIRIQNVVNALNVRHVELPSSRLEIDGRVAVLTGWGRDTTGGASPVLQFAWTTISVDGPKCRSINTNGHSLQPIICATKILDPAQVYYSCLGDSGSPLVVQDGRKFVLVGVGNFNWNEKECSILSTEFTNIEAVRDWIRQHANI